MTNKVLYKPNPDDCTVCFVPCGDDNVAEMSRYVVCAANRSGNGKIFLGVRHFCPLMVQSVQDAGLKGIRAREQGFVDQWGNFMSREEAWKVAVARGQIRRKIGYSYEEDHELVGILYSEHLY